MKNPFKKKLKNENNLRAVAIIGMPKRGETIKKKWKKNLNKKLKKNFFFKLIEMIQFALKQK
jgi:hypothetical protein